MTEQHEKRKMCVMNYLIKCNLSSVTFIGIQFFLNLILLYPISFKCLRSFMSNVFDQFFIFFPSLLRKIRNSFNEKARFLNFLPFLYSSLGQSSPHFIYEHSPSPPSIDCTKICYFTLCCEQKKNKL